MRRTTVLVFAGAVPLVCLVAASSSLDLAAALPFTVLGWLLLLVTFRRPPAATWIGSRRT